jgi:hypothetical protein
LGGAIAQENIQGTIGGCNFDKNAAQSQGGALYQSNSTGDVTTCTFSNNTAANGGGIYQNIGQGTSARVVKNPCNHMAQQKH